MVFISFSVKENSF